MTDANNAGSDPSAGAGNANPDNKGETPKSGAGSQTVPLPELLKEREQRQALQAEVESLKATIAGLSTTPGPAAFTPRETPESRNAELDELWREDPRRAMQTELMLAMNWRDRVEADVDTQIDTVSGKYPDFSKYQGEIKRYLRSIPVGQRNKPGVVDAAYFMVKGQHADKDIQAEVEARLKKMTSADLAQMLGGGSSGGGEGQSEGKAMTPEMKAVAAAMGVSEEEYLKHMKG